MAHVLIVDDERQLCAMLAALVHTRGHTSQIATSGEAALAAMTDRAPDLALLDLHLDGMDGMETLRRIQRARPGLPVVIITAYGNVSNAVAAMKQGAIDFITKPFENAALLGTIDKLLVMPRGTRTEGAPTLIGESQVLRETLDLALKFAVPDINILLLGETGTGKELFARTIHAASKRHAGPFVAVDCTMLAENLIESELFGHEKGAFTGATAARIGRFEMAQGGTLFLDEIGNLPLSLQTKLLRVLQERYIERVGGRETIRLDVRVIAATNAHLKDAARLNSFRQDLYYRLSEMTIHLPPLRERLDDVPHIAEHFVQVYAGRFAKGVQGLSPEALAALSSYDWPGNVRELENTIKRAVVLADSVVELDHLPRELRPNRPSAPPRPTPLTEPDDVASDRLKVEFELGLGPAEIDLKALGAEAAEHAERSLLTTLIQRSHMSGAQMAKMLNVDPKTLRIKLRKYGLEIV